MGIRSLITHMHWVAGIPKEIAVWAQVRVLARQQVLPVQLAEPDQPISSQLEPLINHCCSCSQAHARSSRAWLVGDSLHHLIVIGIVAAVSAAAVLGEWA